MIKIIFIILINKINIPVKIYKSRNIKSNKNSINFFNYNYNYNYSYFNTK